MSFLASLLHRELPGLAGGGVRPLPRSTAGPGVVPRLPSRFEDPGAPEWEAAAQTEGAAAGPDPAPLPRQSTIASPHLVQPARPPAEPRPAPRFAHDEHRCQEGQAVPSAGLPAQQPAPGPPWIGQGVLEQGRLPLPAEAAPRWRAQAAPLFPAAATPDPAAGASRAAVKDAEPGGGVRRVVRQAGVEHGSERQSLPTRERPAPAQQPGSVQPRLEPLPPREQAAAPEPAIMVSIGRIEVKAVQAPAPAQRPTGRAGLMSLDEYLDGRP